MRIFHAIRGEHHSSAERVHDVLVLRQGDFACDHFKLTGTRASIQ